MRRIALISFVLVAAVAGLVLTTGASSGGADPYRVRAIFDDGAFAVPGEEVRIAGAPVGTIASLDVTDESGLGSPASCKRRGSACKAALTFAINSPGFTPFHADASCAIRPQSLIGEKFVDCNPGTVDAPLLARITAGAGVGTYLLPVTRTSSPVDTDIVQDIYREPVRQQLAIILNELGAGLAARGSDLNAVIHRADPALGYTDQVLQILARQNRQLAQLARDSATVLTPLARARKQIADFVVQANTTSVASAARANDIARSLQLLPGFLRQLRPLMVDLGSLADQGTPLFTSLDQSATALGRQFVNLVPFARAARTALIRLGASAVKQQPLLLATIPLAKGILNLGNAGVPSFGSLDRLTKSLDRTGAIEQLMALLFYGTTASNGFDSVGHYVRDQVLVGDCTGYAKTPVPGCSANFQHTGAATDATAATTSRLLRVVRDTRASGVQPSTSATLGGLLHYLIGNGP
jgi:ABC-type transporter Mla subunit MlaD